MLGATEVTAGFRMEDFFPTPVTLPRFPICLYTNPVKNDFISKDCRVAHPWNLVFQGCGFLFNFTRHVRSSAGEFSVASVDAHRTSSQPLARCLNSVQPSDRLI